MKKYFFIVIAFVALTIVSHAQGVWTQKTDFGGSARETAVAFSIGDKGYIGTGQYVATGSTKDFWEYDPATDTWTQKADFGGSARYSAAGFSIGNKGYIGTGTDNSGVVKDFWEYDPAGNTWTKKADFAGQPRTNAFGLAIGSKGYIGTGQNSLFTLKDDVWEYDPTNNTWTRKANFGGGLRQLMCGFSIGTKGYVGTGNGGVDGYTKDFWEYDPSSNTWTQKADFGGHSRYWAVGLAIGDKGYIGTGWYMGDLYQDFWEYDPLSDTWTQMADFGGGQRFKAVSFSISDKGYVGTGFGFGVGIAKDLWEYAPGEMSCPAPTNLFVANISATSAQVNWTIEATPDFFLVSYKAANGDSTIKRVPGTSSSKIISGLVPDTRYVWGVKAQCGTSKSPTAYGDKFKTALLKEGESDDLPINGSLNLYPNPASESFTVHLQTQEVLTTQAIVQIVNMLGQVMYTRETMIVDGMLNERIVLNPEISEGICSVKVIVGEKNFSELLVLEK